MIAACSPDNTFTIAAFAFSAGAFIFAAWGRKRGHAEARAAIERYARRKP